MNVAKTIVDMVHESTNVGMAVGPLPYRGPDDAVRTKRQSDNLAYLDINSRYHRLDGPAVVYDNGSDAWYYHGKLHREGGPAVSITRMGGFHGWYKHGNHHRTDGPAVVGSNGLAEWWVDGRQFTEEEFDLYVDQSTGEVLVPPGKKLTHDQD